MVKATRPPSIRRFFTNLSANDVAVQIGIADGSQGVENGGFTDVTGRIISTIQRGHRPACGSDPLLSHLPATGTLNRSP
jgi:hypothetical protein